MKRWLGTVLSSQIPRGPLALDGPRPLADPLRDLLIAEEARAAIEIELAGGGSALAIRSRVRWIPARSGGRVESPPRTDRNPLNRKEYLLSLADRLWADR